MGVFLILGAARSGAEPDNLARILGDSIADVVEQVMPSVVEIRTEAVRYHLWRDVLFGRQYRVPERTAGLGSGVIISEDGHVLTSHHVIAGAQQIEVVLHNGRIYRAERIGGDPHTDLAVVRILADDGARFTPVAFGDSDNLRVGEIVMAIGSPYSLHATVTMGIVSQKGRTIGLLPYEDFIQTQAPINPGNSGGPLVDADGRMVGINAAIHSGGGRTPGNIGIGFAVPVNLALRVAHTLIDRGEIVHPWIGVLMSMTADGVVVENVYRDSPAEAGGIRRGDIITHMDQRPVSTIPDVRRAVFQHASTEPIPVTLIRNGETTSVQITPVPMPDMNTLQR